MQKVILKPKEEQLPVQIFPDPQESEEESSTRMKRRLPSIVVELTESGEVESGELRWPPDDIDPGAPLEFEPGTDSPLRTHPDHSRPPPLGPGEAADPSVAETVSRDKQEVDGCN